MANQDLYYIISDKESDSSIFRFTKVNPVKRDYGRYGSENTGLKIKVRNMTTKYPEDYGFAEFQKEFEKRLSQEDIEKVVSLIPGRELYANIPFWPGP